MKNIRNILIIMFITVSFLTMIGSDVFHHHKDGLVHNECPICLLNTVSPVIAAFTFTIFYFRRAVTSGPVYTDVNTNIFNNLLSFDYPNRAPPAA
jgi:hypothetical protein